MSRSFTKNTGNIVALSTRDRLHNLLAGSARVTWATWIYPRSVSGTSTTSDSFWATAVSSSSAGLVGKLDTNRRIGSGGRAASGDTYAPAYSTGAIPLNRWSHVAAVLDVEQDRIRFYIGGILDSEVAHSWSSVTAVAGGVTTGTERIGARSNGSTNSEQIDGLLAQLAFWRRELSADEILELSRGLVPEALPNGLAAAFPLNGADARPRSIVSDLEGVITGSIPVAEDPPVTRMRGRRSANDWIAATISTGGGGVVGSASIADDTDVVTASGSVAIGGTAAITDATDTVASSGTLAVAGAASITDTADSITAAGAVGSGGVTGSAAITDATDAVTASGSAPIVGAAAISDTADGIVASGGPRVTGSAALTEAADAVSANGSLPIAGFAFLIDGTDAVQASGVNSSGISAAIVNISARRSSHLITARRAAATLTARPA